MRSVSPVIPGFFKGKEEQKEEIFASQRLLSDS